MEGKVISVHNVRVCVGEGESGTNKSEISNDSITGEELNFRAVNVVFNGSMNKKLLSEECYGVRFKWQI